VARDACLGTWQEIFTLNRMLEGMKTVYFEILLADYLNELAVWTLFAWTMVGQRRTHELKNVL